MLSLDDADVGSPDAEIWKLCPEPADSRDSTDGKGSASCGPRCSGGGGVKVRCSGDGFALYCCRWPNGRKPGGSDDRFDVEPPPSAADADRRCPDGPVVLDGGKADGESCGICFHAKVC